jgi:hypothetical protein
VDRASSATTAASVFSGNEVGAGPAAAKVAYCALSVLFSALSSMTNFSRMSRRFWLSFAFSKASALYYDPFFASIIIRVWSSTLAWRVASASANSLRRSSWPWARAPAVFLPAVSTARNLSSTAVRESVRYCWISCTAPTSSASFSWVAPSAPWWLRKLQWSLLTVLAISAHLWIRVVIACLISANYEASVCTCTQSCWQPYATRASSLPISVVPAANCAWTSDCSSAIIASACCTYAWTAFMSTP